MSLQLVSIPQSVNVSTEFTIKCELLIATCICLTKKNCLSVECLLADKENEPPLEILQTSVYDPEEVLYTINNSWNTGDLNPLLVEALDGFTVYISSVTVGAFLENTVHIPIMVCMSLCMYVCLQCIIRMYQ